MGSWFKEHIHGLTCKLAWVPDRINCMSSEVTSSVLKDAVFLRSLVSCFMPLPPLNPQTDTEGGLDIYCVRLAFWFVLILFPLHKLLSCLTMCLLANTGISKVYTGIEEGGILWVPDNFQKFWTGVWLCYQFHMMDPNQKWEKENKLATNGCRVGMSQYCSNPVPTKG